MAVIQRKEGKQMANYHDGDEEQKTSYLNIECEVIRTTPKAIQFGIEDGPKMWVPKSICSNGHNDFEDGDEICLKVAEWFCKKNGLDNLAPTDFGPGFDDGHSN